MKILAIIVILGFLAIDHQPDTVKVNAPPVKQQVAQKRSYKPMQKQLTEQNLKLDSLILKLQNDTIPKK